MPMADLPPPPPPPPKQAKKPPATSSPDGVFLKKQLEQNNDGPTDSREEARLLAHMTKSKRPSATNVTGGSLGSLFGNGMPKLPPKKNPASATNSPQPIAKQSAKPPPPVRSVSQPTGQVPPAPAKFPSQASLKPLSQPSPPPPLVQDAPSRTPLQLSLPLRNASQSSLSSPRTPQNFGSPITSQSPRAPSQSSLAPSQSSSPRTPSQSTLQPTSAPRNPSQSTLQPTPSPRTPSQALPITKPISPQTPSRPPPQSTSAPLQFPHTPTQNSFSTQPSPHTSTTSIANEPTQTETPLPDTKQPAPRTPSHYALAPLSTKATSEHDLSVAISLKQSFRELDALLEDNKRMYPAAAALMVPKTQNHATYYGEADENPIMELDQLISELHAAAAPPAHFTVPPMHTTPPPVDTFTPVHTTTTPELSNVHLSDRFRPPAPHDISFGSLLDSVERAALASSPHKEVNEPTSITTTAPPTALPTTIPPTTAPITAPTAPTAPTIAPTPSTTPKPSTTITSITTFTPTTTISLDEVHQHPSSRLPVSPRSSIPPRPQHEDSIDSLLDSMEQEELTHTLKEASALSSTSSSTTTSATTSTSSSPAPKPRTEFPTFSARSSPSSSRRTLPQFPQEGSVDSFLDALEQSAQLHSTENSPFPSPSPKPRTEYPTLHPIHSLSSSRTTSDQFFDYSSQSTDSPNLSHLPSPPSRTPSILSDLDQSNSSIDMLLDALDRTSQRSPAPPKNYSSHSLLSEPPGPPSRASSATQIVPSHLTPDSSIDSLLESLEHSSKRSPRQPSTDTPPSYPKPHTSPSPHPTNLPPKEQYQTLLQQDPAFDHLLESLEHTSKLSLRQSSMEQSPKSSPSNERVHDSYKPNPPPSHLSTLNTPLTHPNTPSSHPTNFASPAEQPDGSIDSLLESLEQSSRRPQQTSSSRSIHNKSPTPPTTTRAPSTTTSSSALRTTTTTTAPHPHKPSAPTSKFTNQAPKPPSTSTPPSSTPNPLDSVDALLASLEEPAQRTRAPAQGTDRRTQDTHDAQAQDAPTALRGLSNLIRSAIEVYHPETICSGCAQPIHGRHLFALGRHWHNEHLKCVLCDTTISAYAEHGEKPYCGPCYTSYILAPQCAGCGEAILSEIIEAMGNRYHISCFVCAECHNSFPNDVFVESKGRVFCESCYYEVEGKRCGGCGDPITDGAFTEILGKNLHNRCFKCHNCHTPFTTMECYPVNNNPYCYNCASAID